jgi:glycosyltransferase involved in cell wall biosynthesis
MEKPKISVIVPAYNEEKYIAKTLQTLKDQTYKNYEIIVVNNNSTDNTGKVAKELVKKVYLEKKKGYNNAVNRGVKEAKADIITICDADTLYPNNWVEKIIKDFEKDKDVIAVYGTCRFYDSGFIVNSLAWLFFTPFLKISLLLGFHNTPGFNFAMKKWAYKKVGGYDPKIFNSILMDVQLGKRLQSIGKMKQDTSLIVYTSARRFSKDGLLKTTWYFFDAWVRLNFGKKQKMSYEEYNKEYR